MPFVVRFSIHAIQPRAVVPENFSPCVARDFHGHKVIHCIRPMRISVRIIGRDYDIVVANSFDHIADQILFHIDGNETLAQKVIARPQAHPFVTVTFAHFPALVQTVHGPRQPTAVTFEKRHTQIGKAFGTPPAQKQPTASINSTGLRNALISTASLA